MILPNDDEILGALTKDFMGDDAKDFRDIAKAQLKKVVEWINNHSFHSNSKEYQDAAKDGQVISLNALDVQSLVDEVKDIDN